MKLAKGIACCAILVAVQACGGAVADTATPDSSLATTQPPSSAGTGQSGTAASPAHASAAAPDGLAASASTESLPPPSPSPSPFGFLDAAYLRDTSSRATFSVVVDRRDPQSGLLVLGIPSLGLLRTASSATMDSHDDGSIEVSYGGIGDLDRDAQLDLDYGVAVRSSGSSDKVVLTIRATIGSDLRTGSVTVTVAGHRYAITDRAPTESAQATLDALAITTRKQDWRAWYGLLSSTVTRSVSEADWVAQMQAGVESSGRVVEAEAGGLTYRSDAYLDFASAPFTITVEKDGVRRELDYTVTLAWEGAGWRFVTTTPAPSP
ncbi:MAG: hypothetical protein ACXW4H_07065 [Candidatus Limnocylindrales bacterium]